MDSDEDKEPVSNHIRNPSSEEDMNEKEPLKNFDEQPSNVFQLEPPMFHKNLSTLEIPTIDDTFMNINTKIQSTDTCSKDFSLETILDGYEAAEDLFDSQQNHTPSVHELSDDEDEPCIDENVLQRINSHKETNSLQLGRQLSCTWSTGAGPRIGCLRDYPTELQSHALEQANLSPKSAPSSLRFTYTELCTSPLSFENESLLRRNNRPYRTQSTLIHIGSVNLKSTDFRQQPLTFF